MVPSDAVVLIDRFISASSAIDAINSLKKLVDAYKENANKQNKDEDERTAWDPGWIFEHDEIVDHLIFLLQHGTLKANDIPCEEGVHLVCQLYQYLITTSDALKIPSSGALLESLLDALDNSENPVYVRVLALKVLEEISKRHKQIAVNQWLQAPNGLHRIADLLAIDVDNNPMEEAVRNQALIVAKILACEAPMAKVFLFAEVECKLLDLCWKQGGITKGSPIVIDALELIKELLKHADTSLQDLVWQRPNVAPRLIQLLDLRGGDEFLHPSQRTSSDLQGDNEDDDDDDLDSLLASGDTKSSKGEKESLKKLPVPHLLPGEEHVIKLVLDILCLLLEADSVRHNVSLKHSGLCKIVWELALVSGPLDPPVCALPSPMLQQKALNVVADKFNDPITMDHLSGLDRLLYLVCTGGEVSEKFDDKLGLSQSALAVLRQSLSRDRIHDILMQTLAPPPTEDESIALSGPTVVQKLWNTVQENLTSKSNDRRTLFLSGALGGLGLMLCDEQSREIMSKVAPISLDQLLESLYSEKDDFVQCSLVRFFCEWIYESSFMTHNLLCSTASTHLAEMATVESSYRSLIHLLLGLAMEYMTKEEECGGWTRNGILQIVIKIGTSKYTSSLEGLKSTTNSKMPWVVSEMERKNWKIFCRLACLTVRKCVVEELAGGSADTDDEIDDNESITDGDGTNSFSNHGLRPLQKLISQQSKEMNGMRIEMDGMRAKIISQDDQLNTWRRRIESTPTELDDLLNEFTSKNITAEETIQALELELERKKSEKENETKLLEEKLSESRDETDRLLAVEQDCRDELERTEQEMKSLSEAYANLEEEYQRNQNRQEASAPAGETSQQLQGEDSHQQTVVGSNETATLRAENTRLKNDARAADEWMSTAVQKLNNIGTANVDLERQVAVLHIQIRTAEERASSVENIKTELEDEKKKSETLTERITEAHGELSKYENIEMQIENEQKRSASLEKRLFEAEEEIRANIACLEDERKAKTEIENQLSHRTSDSFKNESSSLETGSCNEKQLELLRSDYDKMVATKNAEITALEVSLQINQSDEPKIDWGKLTDDEISDIRGKKSQEEIFRLESIIRELENRLGNELGGYTIEDIINRDEEIEELRTSNGDAQEWMSKAVKHHQMNSVQISKLTEEKSTLILQLDEERMKEASLNSNDSSSSSFILSDLAEKSHQLDVMKEHIAIVEVELDKLKEEKKANQGLLDELGIATDDVKIMQQQLLEYKSIVTDLEIKLTGNRLNDENLELKACNKDLQSKIVEFEEWTEAAQTKISDILESKNQAENQLLIVKESFESLQKGNETVQINSVELDSDKSAFKKLQNDISSIQSTNNNLQQELKKRESLHSDLQSKFESLLEKVRETEENLNSLTVSRDDIANDLKTERRLSIARCTEIEDLKAGNMNLLASMEKLKDENQSMVNANDLLKNKDKDDSKEEKVGELLEELEKTKASLTLANDTLLKDEDIVREWEDQVLRLESDLANVNQQMEEQEREALDAITLWQQNNAESEKRCTELEEKLSNTIDARESSEITDGVSNESDYIRLIENNSSLQEKINALESSLANKSNHQEIDEISELRKELDVAQNSLSKDEVVVHQWEERVAELQLAVESLRNELTEQENEANDVISQWQDSCAEAETKYTILEGEFERIKSKQSDVLIDQATNDQIQNRNEVDALSFKKEELRQAHLDRESHQDLIDELKDQVSSLESKIQEIQKKSDRAQAEKLKLDLKYQERLDQSEKECLQQEIEAKETVESKENELRELRKILNSNNESQDQDKDRIQELSHHIESMKESLRNQELETKHVTDQLKEKFDASKKETISLREILEETKIKYDELQARQHTILDNSEDVRQWGKKCSELTKYKLQLEDQLKEQEHDACEAIAQWQDTCSDLETKCSILEVDVNESLQKLSNHNWSIEQLTSRNDSYCAFIKELKSNSIKVETSGQAELSYAKSKISSLTEEIKIERKNRTDERDQLQSEVLGEQKKCRISRDEIKVLNSSLEELKAESENTLNQWIARYEELDLAFKERHQQLEEQESEANEVISMWESKVDELEGDLDLAEDQLQQLGDVLVVQGSLNGGSKNIIELAENIVHETNDLSCRLRREKSLSNEQEEKIEDFRSRNEILTEKLSNNEESLQVTESELHLLKHQLTLKSQDKLEEERDRLIGEVAQIEEELREANVMLQACVTNSTTEKASEVAANALRDEVNHMRSQLNECQQKYQDEKTAREVAGLEVNRLSDDIATLLSLSEHENNPTTLKKLATKSIKKLQKIEHAEIDDLRKSLFRALEDLELTRLAEKDSNETISKLRLHISVYEQDIIAAKSEVNFLSEAMEELRQTEDSKGASLEYRIGSLENENDVVRKYQAAELENVRNELAQVSMEKDMIMHELKETEKTNASLILAASNDDNNISNRRNSTESECAKLRIENTHLLQKAADDAGRAERKLREIVSGQIACSELDVIVERELRLSAEKTQEILKEELMQLQSRRDAIVSCNHVDGDNDQENKLDMKTNELDFMRSSLQSMENEISRLKLEMKEETSKAKNVIHLLTEECRKAQVKACKFDQNTQLQSELTKMRSPTIFLNGDRKYWKEDFMSSSTRNTTVLTENCERTSLSSAEVFDLVRKQKEEIQEERLLWAETLQEHEGLLALVAQQDLEKSFLKEALVDVTGNENMADEALKRAEALAVKRYGNAVQVINNQ